MVTSINGFDRQVEQFLYLHRTVELSAFFSWLTSFGDVRIITILGISMAIVLFRHHKSAYVAGLALAIFGSFLFSYALKLIVARDRPLPSLALIDAPGYSFPSMHAACSMALYGFLIYMIYTLLHPARHRLPVAFATAALIALIGFSRIYLGVHYLSDVLGGFFVGGIFLWLAILLTLRLERQTRNAVWRR
jgi:undecaprenyl-diphosphatase